MGPSCTFTASGRIISSFVRPWVLTIPGIGERQRGKIRCCRPHPLERGFLLPCLRVLAEQLQACSQQVSALLRTLAAEPGDGEGPSDVALVLSLPGVGRKMTAWLFAEAAQPIAERDYQR